MKSIQFKSDLIGASASGLCLIHCLATPLIFVAKTCTATCCTGAPDWWRWIDFIFLIVAFIAIYQSSKHSNSKWIKTSLWGGWVALLFVICNEYGHFIDLPSTTIYIPAVVLIGLHLYNLYYCRCISNGCLTN